MDFDEKIEELRRQSKDDFKFVMIALDNTTKAMDSVVKELSTLKAKMARQEERFEMMLDAVQHELKRRADAELVQDLLHRVEAIEKKINPAA